MSRLIDADALIRRFHDSPTFEMSEFLRTLAIDFVKEAPTIDAVEVVRCRDCAFRDRELVNGRGSWFCSLHEIEIAGNDYCNYGERRVTHD